MSRGGFAPTVPCLQGHGSHRSYLVRGPATSLSLSKAQPSYPLPIISRNPLRPRNLARLIEQCIYPFEESHGMRQLRVFLERRFICPSRLNVKQSPVPHRPKILKARAAAFLARTAPQPSQRLLNGILCP